MEMGEVGDRGGREIESSHYPGLCREFLLLRHSVCDMIVTVTRQ